MNRNGIKVIHGGIKRQRSEKGLYPTERQPDDISPEHPFADQKSRDIQKNAPQAAVLLTERFQNADHVGTFKDDDQQPRNHRKARYGHHQYKDHRNIQVKHIKPTEYHRIQFFYRTNIKNIPFTVTTIK